MVTLEDVFIKTYRGYQNRVTPYVDQYFGSIFQDGRPDQSYYICELSHGKIPNRRFNGRLVYGVTVIEYNTFSCQWDVNEPLTRATTNQRKALKYIKNICHNGFSLVL